MDQHHIFSEDAHPRTWSLTGKLKTGTPGGLRVNAPNLLATGYSVFTVKFGVLPPANGKGFNALATITFSINGSPIVRKVSVGSGVEISGPADAITVHVDDVTPAAYANNGQDYQVTCAIAPGTRANSPYPTLDDVSVGGSGIYVLPTTGATTSIPIPQDAGVVGAWVSAITTSAASLNPTTTITAASSGVTTNLFETGLTDPMVHFLPIPPGAINLIAGNRDTTNINALTVLWVVDG